MTSHLIGAITVPAYMDCHSVPGRSGYKPSQMSVASLNLVIANPANKMPKVRNAVGIETVGFKNNELLLPGTCLPTFRVNQLSP